MRTCLGTVFSMGYGRGGQHAVAAELGFELPGEEVLELVGLDGEDVGLEETIALDAVGDDLRRGTPGKVGFDVDDAVAIDAEGDEGGVIAAARVRALAGIEGHGFDDEIVRATSRTRSIRRSRIRAIRRDRDWSGSFVFRVRRRFARLRCACT